ncbi:hypothetical protein AGIG_G9149 [Arapaima gigas]
MWNITKVQHVSFIISPESETPLRHWCAERDESHQLLIRSPAIVSAVVRSPAGTRSVRAGNFPETWKSAPFTGCVGVRFQDAGATLHL